MGEICHLFDDTGDRLEGCSSRRIVSYITKVKLDVVVNSRQMYQQIRDENIAGVSADLLVTPTNQSRGVPSEGVGHPANGDPKF